MFSKLQNNVCAISLYYALLLQNHFTLQVILISSI